jgi:hypothetical protein
MPTAERRRLKRQNKRDEKRAIKLHSTVAVGHRMPTPEPPDFGPPKWTPEEQAANPDKPMTRVIKDVLREGRWKEGFDELGRPIFGDYTPEELGIILNNAIAMMNDGEAINYGKSHGDDQLIIPTDELISPVDDIRLANGVIWTSTYVTPAQAAYLLNPAMKVSAGLHRDYLAGSGKVYKGRTMLHVAVTDRPSVGRQGPFMLLSNYVALGTWESTKKPVEVPKPEVKPDAASSKVAPVAKPAKVIARPVRKFAKRKFIRPKFKFKSRMRPIALANNLQGGLSMDPTILEAINFFLQQLGIEPIPDGMPPEQVGPLLKGIAMALGASSAEETAEGEANGAGTGTAADLGLPGAGGAAPAPMAMANLLKQVDKRIADGITAGLKPMQDGINALTAAVSGKQAIEVNDKKAKYIAFRNALGKAGVTEAVLATKDKFAEKTDWDTDILEGLHPTIKLSNFVSAAGATETKPEDKPANAPLSDEEVQARIIARGGNPANMPGYKAKV